MADTQVRVDDDDVDAVAVRVEDTLTVLTGRVEDVQIGRRPGRIHLTLRQASALIAEVEWAHQQRLRLAEAQ